MFPPPPPPPPNFQNGQPGPPKFHGVPQQQPPPPGSFAGQPQRFQAPPPPPQQHQPMTDGFAPPPPMNRGFAPPPHQQAPRGFGAPPNTFGPPTTSSQPPPPMEQMQNSMNSMSIGGQKPQGFGAPPPPPTVPSGRFAAAPQMFQQQQPPPGAPPPPVMDGTKPASSPFYQQTAAPPPPSQPQLQAPSMPGVPGGIYQENVDFSIQIPERLMRFSVKTIPQTSSLSGSSKLNFGAILRPLAPAVNEPDVDVVNPGAAGIVRCKRCRTYINAYVTWMEQGRRWRCNICGQLNECPSAYFCHLDENSQRRDRLQRPELSKSVVEFVAPSEYMVRPPQTPAFFFVIDVSATAVRSGVLTHIANSIRQSLDDLPGGTRTQIGFITFDNSVHYYILKAGFSAPKMMVVADLKELFVPAPDDLLVNLKECRDVVDVFLDNLPTMFNRTQVTDSCLGPALKAAFTVTKHVGGKMLVFQSVLPTLGDGALKPRENFRAMGTPEEGKLLRPAITWYKDTAVEFSRAQISVDMFLFPFQYIDSASLSELPKLTAGTLKTFAAFDTVVDGPKFESELKHSLTQNIAFEAVMRIRCTKGMRISNFYGNFLIRGTDLLALPNCTSDSVFAFDLAHDEQSVTSSVVTVQGALLYTSSDGERRIRVLTQALPVTMLLTELLNSVDAETLCNLLAKQAIDMALKTNLDNARTRLQQICMDIIRVSKEGDRRAMAGYGPPGTLNHDDNGNKPILENLQLLPLYTLAMIKNVTFRGGTDVHPDERLQFMQYLVGMWVSDGNYFMYPRMFSVHDMDQSAGLPWSEKGEVDDEELYAGRNRILLPKVVSLSVDNLSSDGIFLLDNSIDMYIWIGRSVDPSFLGNLFGIETLDGIESSSQVRLKENGNDFAGRLNSIVKALRDDRGTVPKVTIVIEGDVVREQRFFWHFVEDRASFSGGNYNYREFMSQVNRVGPAPNQPPGQRVGMQGGVMMPQQQPGPPRMPLPPQQAGGMMSPPPPPQQAGGMMPPPPQQAGTMMPPPHQPGPPIPGTMMPQPPAPPQQSSTMMPPQQSGPPLAQRHYSMPPHQPPTSIPQPPASMPSRNFAAPPPPPPRSFNSSSMPPPPPPMQNQFQR